MTAATGAADPGLWRRVIVLLSFGNFVVGFAAFVAIGVLTPMAQALAAGPATAGLPITAYAVAYALFAPLLTAMTGARARAAVIVVSLAAVTAGAITCAAAPNLSVLLAGRAAAAVGAGVFSASSAALAAAISTPEARGRALSAVFFGFTLAQLAGIPIGTWLGYRYGWRVAFGLSAGMAGMAALLAAVFLPRGVRTQTATVATLLSVLADGRLTLAAAFTATFTGATYVVYTFLSPIVQAKVGGGGYSVSLALLVCGIGGVIGNVVSGLVVGRTGPDRALAVMCLVQAATMPALTLLPLGWPGLATILFLWSAFGWGFYVPQQMRLIAMDPQRAQVLLAVTAAFLYVGIALGSALSGLIVSQFGLAATGIGGGLVAIGAIWHLHVSRPRS